MGVDRLGLDSNMEHGNGSPCPGNTTLICIADLTPITPDPTIPPSNGYQPKYDFGGMGYAPEWPSNPNSNEVKWGRYICSYQGGVCSFVAPGLPEDYYGTEMTIWQGHELPSCPVYFEVDPGDPHSTIRPAFIDAIKHNYQGVPKGTGGQ